MNVVRVRTHASARTVSNPIDGNKRPPFSNAGRGKDIHGQMKGSSLIWVHKQHGFQARSLHVDKRQCTTLTPKNYGSLTRAMSGFKLLCAQLREPLTGYSIRPFQSTCRRSQHTVTTVPQDVEAPPLLSSNQRQSKNKPLLSLATPLETSQTPKNIRAQLRLWQELHGQEEPLANFRPYHSDIRDEDEPTNHLTRLPDGNTLDRQATATDEEQKSYIHFNDRAKEGFEGDTMDNNRFLQMGDLVEIEFPNSERESILAVYVRRIVNRCQLYSMQGRWLHYPERLIQYSIPGWVSPNLVRPLLEHLPDPETAEELEDLRDLAYMEDLSVPREVAAPLVEKMVTFHTESQEAYRQHASKLDAAHDILAHPIDLRYGSLISAATTLLGIPSHQLPLTALFAVRKALTNGGFAFSIDPRSHRLTGYLQIRSKQQVETVDNVRDWLRQWQDDLALTSNMDDRQLKNHRPAKGADILYSFLEKAKPIIVKSRESRLPTKLGNVGPSKERFPITETSGSVKAKAGKTFSSDEKDVIRFIEAWCCSVIFSGLPRLESLPPLLLQATGLYNGHTLSRPTGFLFLQELGIISPFENRVHFDQHLLLPSSQHSRPLKNLMLNLIEMESNHEFIDSMADLRHDWKELPVYCIDNADAQEIDDGVSVEKIKPGSEGMNQYWVHVHIANPTAFFSRDHSLSKMARHMGETIYMPEKNYTMLPHWATESHFSLAKNRPCLTFSARMDQNGSVLERKITNGVVRNVIRLTPKEVEGLLGIDHQNGWLETVLTVGGKPPPPPPRKSSVSSVAEVQIQELGILQQLANKRTSIRKIAGGVFFDFHSPEVNVWQTWGSSGLVSDIPCYKHSRLMEGDPVVQMRTRDLINWFTPATSPASVLVREMMLLACETAASWCAERQIPIIYRGTVSHPDKPEADKYLRDVLVPNSNDAGEYPMHLGAEYISYLGSTVLRSKPIRHRILGMDHYSKVTSPLRRYGDMIVHWQIEAALRHEAETGQSLVQQPVNADSSSFLTFSRPTLDAIMLGLQPREQTITRSKQHSNAFWISMLLFRMHHFGEDGGLPFDTLRVLVHSDPQTSVLYDQIGTIAVELNTRMLMTKPQQLGLGEARHGDVWECRIDSVDVYKRMTLVTPLRLLERVQ